MCAGRFGELGGGFRAGLEQVGNPEFGNDVARPRTPEVHNHLEDLRRGRSLVFLGCWCSHFIRLIAETFQVITRVILANRLKADSNNGRIHL